MLRTVYAAHLPFFSLFVFLMGILLLPIGYLAVLVTRARIVYRERGLRHRREWGMARNVSSLRESGNYSMALTLFFQFLFLGPFTLLIRNFKDTYAFA